LLTLAKEDIMHGYVKLILVLTSLIFLSGLGNSNAGVVGEWFFNDSKTPGADTTANGNNGVLNGGAKWVAGHIGGAIDFNGSDSFVEIPDAEILAPLEGSTVCIWVYPRSYNLEWIGIFGKGGNRTDFDLLINMSDKKAHWYVSGVAGDFNVVSQETVPLNKWTHLAATYKSGDKIEVYINGKFSAQTAMAEARNPSKGSILMGNSIWPNRWFDGKLDEAYLFDEKLNEAGIQNIMEKNTNPVESNGKISTVWGNIKNLN
jgi:hypothetical protein